FTTVITSTVLLRNHQFPQACAGLEFQLLQIQNNPKSGLVGKGLDGLFKLGGGSTIDAAFYFEQVAMLEGRGRNFLGTASERVLVNLFYR
ncbi:MAG TPA: hypothetical protein VF355_06680, partial [Anaerolineaceae bacterium]